MSADFRVAVPGGDFGFPLAWRTPGGRTCCAVNLIAQACPKCQAAQDRDVTGLPSSVGRAHAATRNTAVGVAAQLAYAAWLDSQGAGSWDRALHRAGRAEQAVEIVRDRHGNPLPYSTALAKGGR
jgi:hypothetical protein